MKTIALTQGKVALVDDADFTVLSRFNWCAFDDGEGRFYAKRGFRINGKLRQITMHRQILNPPSELLVDHRNGNGLDNRRRNLRACTCSQNLCNQRHRKGRSGLKGVSITKNGRIYARIVVRYRQIRLGSFNSPVVAAKAYDDAARNLHGDFASLNY